MEKINKHNYEAFFLDYYEKNLSAEKVADLMLFLENNPQFKEDFDEYEEFVLEPDTQIKFQNKNTLKKEIFENVGNVTSENYEDYIIADLENVISKDERKALNAFLLQNPSAENNYKLYQLTYLKPDLSVVFSNKKDLKQPIVKTMRPLIKRLYYSMAVAASIALLFGIFFMNNSKLEQTKNIFASRNTNLNIPERNVYPENISENPIIEPINKIEGQPKNIQKRPRITVEKIVPKSNVQLATNYDNFLHDIDYNFDFYNNPEFLQLFDYEADNNLASNEDDKANFNDLKDYVTVGINKIIHPEKEIPDSVRKLNGWDIADIGLSGLSKISKQNFEIKKQKAEDGTVQSYKFSANKFEFFHKKRKKY